MPGDDICQDARVLLCTVPLTGHDLSKATQPGSRVGLDSISSDSKAGALTPVPLHGRFLYPLVQQKG